MTYISLVKGKIIETTGGDYNIYAKGDIITTSDTTVSETGVKKGVFFDKDPKKYKPKNAQIVKVEFLDENNKVLKQETLAAFADIQATNFMIGKPVKIKITTKDVADGTQIRFSLKGNSQSVNQHFFDIDKQKWNGTIKGNFFETPLFEFNNMWFSEDLEIYNYTSHKTEITSDALNSFYVKGILNAEQFELPDETERLIPVTYLRNYEELIGLFHTNDSGVKDLVNNYENKFILGSQLENISVCFSEFINHTPKLTVAQIRTRVEQDAKLLWDTAVKQVQSGNLDDRPLYWTRLKMQVRLKQHYLFENDIDFEKSIVKKNSELEKIIQLFEEKSRNYDGVDFSKAGSKKKVLITGFDPFVINPFHPSNPGENDRQNPSGISILNFHGKTVGNAYIQCAMIPVRYEDFDKGIIEKLVENNIGDFDIMMTMSKNDKNFDVERLGGKNRGGYLDNVNIGFGKNSYDSSRFKQIPNGNEFYETTLPIKKIFTSNPGTIINPLYFDQSYTLGNGFKFKHPTKNKIGNLLTEAYPFSSITGKSDEGSGSNYLSNEIMYRATRKRDEMGYNKSRGIGHVHISENTTPKENFSIITNIITNAIK